MAAHLRADSLGNWMPFALADITVMLSAFMGCKTDRYTIMRSWGLETADLEATENEETYQAGIDRLAEIFKD